ncbi:hypothetical protein [Ruegeria faecimaris]|uniref:hypothetical protein n=2 Tax=Ruegeria faecimaris TaxID=686389 RepID=UPI0024921948|nr:hypothetical protein [Ruegeria faecimaris]
MSLGLHELVGYGIGVIWSRDWIPYVEAADYLRHKAIGVWAGGRRSKYASVVRPSMNTILAVANDLTNFFDWCETRHIDWKEISYSQLCQHYQGQMCSGHWSLRVVGKPLSSSTINRRMAYVSDFLEYSALHGLRLPFETERRRIRFYPTQDFLMARAGRVRQHPRDLRLPSPNEIGRWLGGMEKRFGPSIALAAKTAIRLGLRPDEVVNLPLNGLPKVPIDRSRATVKMTIIFGTKGGRRIGDSEKKGKPRRINVPVDLLIELHAYARVRRKKLLAKFRKRNPGEKAPKKLFLTDTAGTTLSYHWFYKVWVASQPLPFDGFSPHLARHIWACFTLKEKIQQEIEISSSDALVSQVAPYLHQTLVDVYLRPQLGHIDTRTSDMYLAWLSDDADLLNLRDSWVSFLEDA